MDWIIDNATKLGISIAVLGTIISWLWLWVKLRWRGSRRSTKNWSKSLELQGDLTLLKLGVKRVNPDTATAEGDAASIYYQSYTAYVYEVVNGVRQCFMRSFVVEVYAFYQWKTERGLGDSVMTQFASAPLPCMGLEERKDAKGASYWVKIPVLDVPIDK